MRTLFLLSIGLALAASASAQFSFTDQTDLLSKTGLGTRVTSGVAVGVADMNGDGKDDIVRFDNASDLSIEYQTAPGEAFGHHVYGDAAASDVWAVAIADVDWNGFNDLYAAGSSGGIELISNDGSGTGYSATRLPDRDIFSQGAIFADINNDGLVDIFACDDVDEPHTYSNNGDGTFSRDPGLLPTNLPGNAESNSGNYAAIWTDFDGDGDGDLYLSKCRQGVNNSNDARRINRLFRNDGVAGFVEAAAAANLRDTGQSWSTDFADIDNDGDLDCFIINHQPISRLLTNNGSGSFIDATVSSGIAGHLGVFGIQALFRDFDNDGFVDLFVTTTNAGGPAATYLLLHNDGDGTFTRVTNVFVESGGGPLSFVHSLAVGDLNHDGFLDVYATRGTGFNNPSQQFDDLLFFNDGNSNHYLAVQLTGTVSNRNGIGARLELHGPWGIQVREVRAGEGYGIANTFTQHFGLGAETEATKLVVRWPSGIVDEFDNVAGDRFMQVTEADTLAPVDFLIPAITSTTTAAADSGKSFVYKVEANNWPTSYALGGGAPAGLSLHPQSGVISWPIPVPGEYTLMITATNPAGSDTESLTITVSSGPDFGGALNAPELAWATEGDGDWFPQNAIWRSDGRAAQSGDISDNEESRLLSTVVGPGELSFWWRVSSQQNFDGLRFELDGSAEFQITGLNMPFWEQRTVDIPAGSHSISWLYFKDGSGSSGLDAGFVDEVSYVSEDSDGDGMLDTWELANFGSLDRDGTGDFDGDQQSDLAEFLAGTDPLDSASVLKVVDVSRNGAGATEITWASVAGKSYTIQYSADLTNWVDATTGVLAAGSPTTALALLPSGGTPVSLVDENADVRVLVPFSDIGTLWRGGAEQAFAATGGDADWIQGAQGVGYEAGDGNYATFFNIDTQTQMQNIRGTAYIRIPFEVNDPSLITDLQLEMRFDDGFAAFVNGIPAASDNAPVNLLWASIAVINRLDTEAEDFQSFDLIGIQPLLVPGTNILAIHGLNVLPTSSDFLIQARLTASELPPVADGEGFWRVVSEP